MTLRLISIEYGCSGLEGPFQAKVTITDGQKDFSGEEKSRYCSENAVWNAILDALSPLNIVDANKIRDVKESPGETRGMSIVCSYDGFQIMGHSSRRDRLIALAEALVDLRDRIDVHNGRS